MNTYPRSAYDEVGGIVYFARMLDKIRLHAAGRLPADYHRNLGIAFDGRCSRFLRVEYSALRERVSQGGTDEEILVWHDEEDGTTAELEHYKAQSGLSDRQDLLTLFDYYEVDEHRK